MSEWLFVYGTLRRTIKSPMAAVLGRDAIYVGRAFMRGRLYEVGPYPAASESAAADDKVFGELWRIQQPTPLFKQLDDYEECSAQYPQPHEYVRKVLPVTRDSGEILLAWCYVYNLDTSGLQRIMSGDYLDFI